MKIQNISKEQYRAMQVIQYKMNVMFVHSFLIVKQKKYRPEKCKTLKNKISLKGISFKKEDKIQLLTDKESDDICKCSKKVVSLENAAEGYGHKVGRYFSRAD